MLAALFGHEEAARALLEAGADPDQATDSQENPARTALRVAMANGHAGTGTLLLRHGAEVSGVGPDGRRPLAARLALMRPSKRDRMREVVAVLVAAGATE